MSDQDPKIERTPHGKAFKKVPKGGRVTELDHELIDKVCNNLRLGLFFTDAFVLAGVARETYRQWLKKGHKHKNSIHAELLCAVEKAMVEATARDLKIIDQAANGRPAKVARDDKGNIMIDQKGRVVLLEESIPPNWAAAAWRLSKRKPNQWGTGEHEEDDLDEDNQTFKIEFVETSHGKE